MSPWGILSGMLIQEETLGQTKDSRRAWEHLSVAPRGVGGSGQGEKHLDLPAQDVAPMTQISLRKQNENVIFNLPSYLYIFAKLVSNKF